MEKLRVALEKAKMARQEGPVIGPGAEPPRKGWVSPEYKVSRLADVDMAKAIANRCVALLPDSPEMDNYKILRTKILQIAEQNGWNTVMVTSPQPGEGKTTTAINLALAFAREYRHTVLLVDCDLRRQMVHRLMGFTSDLGLADFLIDGVPFEKIVVWPGIEKLTVISGGKQVAHSAELLGSGLMKSLVEELKGRYHDRYIIFDLPPVLGGADSVVFAPLVDAFIMVVEEGRTSMKDITGSLAQLPRDKFLGFVLNRQKNLKKTSYYYRYGKNGH
jgi:protein-tyrosine kinase